MGGDYNEIDVITRPLVSGKDFQDRISKWTEEVNGENSSDHALVVYFAGIKESITKQGVDFNSVVASVCQK